MDVLEGVIDNIYAYLFHQKGLPSYTILALNKYLLLLYLLIFPLSHFVPSKNKWGCQACRCPSHAYVYDPTTMSEIGEGRDGLSA